jgi:hypothetical protein
MHALVNKLLGHHMHDHRLQVMHALRNWIVSLKGACFMQLHGMSEGCGLGQPNKVVQQLVNNEPPPPPLLCLNYGHALCPPIKKSFLHLHIVVCKADRRIYNHRGANTKYAK